MEDGWTIKMSYHWHWGRHCTCLEWTSIFVIEYNANDLNNDLNKKTNIRPRQSLEAGNFAEITRQQQQIIPNYYSGLTTNLSNFVKENSDISSKLQRSSRIWMTAKFNLPRLLSDSLCILLIELKYLKGLIFCDKSVRTGIPVRSV